MFGNILLRYACSLRHPRTTRKFVITRRTWARPAVHTYVNSPQFTSKSRFNQSKSFLLRARDSSTRHPIRFGRRQPLLESLLYGRRKYVVELNRLSREAIGGNYQCQLTTRRVLRFMFSYTGRRTSTVRRLYRKTHLEHMHLHAPLQIHSESDHGICSERPGVVSQLLFFSLAPTVVHMLLGIDVRGIVGTEAFVETIAIDTVTAVAIFS